MSWYNPASWFRRDDSDEQTSVVKSLVSVVKSLLGGGLISALRGEAPGGWSSDHRAESEKFTGWNYVAIHSIANQCASATVLCYQDEAASSRRMMRRKSLRSQHGSMLRYKSIYGQQDAETDTLPMDHMLVQLMKRPNKCESGAQFRYRFAQQMRLTGKALIWNVPSKSVGANGTPLIYERFVLPTAVATAVTPTADMPMGGWKIDGSASRFAQLIDQEGYTLMSGWHQVLGKTIDARQVQVIQLPHPYWLDDGQSPIAACALWTDTAGEVDTARFYQLKNGLNASAWVDLGPDSNLDQPSLDRVTEKINKKYAGADKMDRVYVSQGNMKVTALSGNSAKEMCYPEAWQDSKAAGLATHQTPPVAVGLQESGAYAAYIASRKAWKDGAIQPLLDMLAESDTELIAPRYGVGITIEIEAQDVDDWQMIEAQLTNDLAAQTITVNEWRAVRGRPPLTAEQGGDRLVGQQQPMQGQPDSAGATGSDPFAAVTGGEFADTSRLQWKRNIAAIQDVLAGLIDGKFDDLLAQTLLESLKLSPERSAALIQSAKDGHVDESEITGTIAPGTNGKSHTNGSNNRLKTVGVTTNKTLLAALSGFADDESDDAEIVAILKAAGRR